MNELSTLQVVKMVIGFLSPVVWFLAGLVIKLLWDKVSGIIRDNDALFKRTDELNNKVNDVEKSLTEKIRLGEVQSLDVFGKVNSTLSRIDETLLGIKEFMKESKEADKRQDEDIRRHAEILSELRSEIGRKTK